MMETDAERWQRIETADREEEVLLYVPGRKATREWGMASRPRIVVGKLFEREHDRIAPTHWMPLPKPPTPTKDTPQ